MPERKPVDWEAIEREYRAGTLSVREIGRRHEVDEKAIRKHALADGWTRALAAKVREAVREKLVRADGSAEGPQSQRADDNSIVDAASALGVEVQLTHRKDLRQLRAIGSILATRLAAILNGEPLDGPCLGERESPGDLFEKLSRVKSRLIPLERQAHNLDDHGATDPTEPSGALDQIARRLAGLAARIRTAENSEGADESPA